MIRGCRDEWDWPVCRQPSFGSRAIDRYLFAGDRCSPERFEKLRCGHSRAPLAGDDVSTRVKFLYLAASSVKYSVSIRTIDKPKRSLVDADRGEGLPLREQAKRPPFASAKLWGARNSLGPFSDRSARYYE